MERRHLIELVEKIQTSSGTEDEVNTLVSEFLKNVPDPRALDYLYEKKYENLTAEQIVDKALSYTVLFVTDRNAYAIRIMLSRCSRPRCP